jgi:hypothetical protein
MRTHFVSGSRAKLFERVPSGADGYRMNYIVHGFNDTDALKIIKCRQTMSLNAKLLPIERFPSRPTSPIPESFWTCRCSS